MKAALRSVTIACTVFACQINHATTTVNAQPQQEAQRPVPQIGHHATKDKRAPESMPLPKPANPRRTPNNPKDSLTGKNVNARARDSEPPNRQRNADVSASRHEVARNASIRRQAVSHSAPPSPNARHHGANPATVGGPGSATVRSTGAVDGRLMSRKP